MKWSARLTLTAMVKLITKVSANTDTHNQFTHFCTITKMWIHFNLLRWSLRNKIYEYNPFDCYCYYHIRIVGKWITHRSYIDCLLVFVHIHIFLLFFSFIYILVFFSVHSFVSSFWVLRLLRYLCFILVNFRFDSINPVHNNCQMPLPNENTYYFVYSIHFIVFRFFFFSIQYWIFINTFIFFIWYVRSSKIFIWLRI